MKVKNAVSSRKMTTKTYATGEVTVPDSSLFATDQILPKQFISSSPGRDGWPSRPPTSRAAVASAR
jgi:hypothetical protein